MAEKWMLFIFTQNVQKKKKRLISARESCKTLTKALTVGTRQSCRLKVSVKT